MVKLRDFLNAFEVLVAKTEVPEMLVPSNAALQHLHQLRDKWLALGDAFLGKNIDEASKKKIRILKRRFRDAIAKVQVDTIDQDDFENRLAETFETNYLFGFFIEDISDALVYGECRSQYPAIEDIDAILIDDKPEFAAEAYRLIQAAIPVAEFIQMTQDGVSEADYKRLKDIVWGSDRYVEYHKVAQGRWQQQ